MPKIQLKTEEQMAGKVDKKMMREPAFLGAVKKFLGDMFGSNKQMLSNNQAAYSPANFSGGRSRTFKMNQRKERKKSLLKRLKRR
ncbi:MAG: hypothetical protein HN597_14905 [Desulfobacula sp.]|nr:hypothetical protein [Desulfobacula sp.]